MIIFVDREQGGGSINKGEIELNLYVINKK
jgi:hypothetical protein